MIVATDVGHEIAPTTTQPAVVVVSATVVCAVAVARPLPVDASTAEAVATPDHSVIEQAPVFAVPVCAIVTDVIPDGTLNAYPNDVNEFVADCQPTGGGPFVTVVAVGAVNVAPVAVGVHTTAVEAAASDTSTSRHDPAVVAGIVTAWDATAVSACCVCCSSAIAMTG